jgi:primosomal protein N'
MSDISVREKGSHVNKRKHSKKIRGFHREKLEFLIGRQLINQGSSHGA